MKRKNILNQLKLEFEDNMPKDVLENVKKIEVKKDLTPVYEEINSRGAVALKSNVKFITGFMGLAILMFMLLMFVVPLINRTINQKAIIVSKLGIDINPSIDLMLDKNDNVVLCLAKNTHAELLINGENFVGKPAQEVTKQIITLATKAGYISTDYSNNIENAVMITAVSEDEDKQESLLATAQTEVKNFFLNNQIYGVVLTEFASKQELVDLISAMQYDLTEEESNNLNSCSVKQLNKILNDCYTQLKRRFRSDFVIEELSKYVAPVCEEYEKVKNQITLELNNVQQKFDNFEVSWQEDIEVCKLKIEKYKLEIAELEEQISAETDPIILAKLNRELEQKQLFLLSEQKELEQRETGSELFNAAKQFLIKEINNCKEKLDQKQAEYEQKMEDKLTQAKNTFEKFDDQVKQKKEDILNSFSGLFADHLNNLGDYNEFYNNYTNWLYDVAPEVENLEKNWEETKTDWENNFASYVSF